MGPSFNTALLHACENTGPSVEGRKSRGRYAKIAKEQFSASYYIFCVRQHTSPQGSDNGLFGLGGRFKALHEGGDGVRQIEDALGACREPRLHPLLPLGGADIPFRGGVNGALGHQVHGGDRTHVLLDFSFQAHTYSRAVAFLLQAFAGHLHAARKEEVDAVARVAREQVQDRERGEPREEHVIDDGDGLGGHCLCDLLFDRNIRLALEHMAAILLFVARDIQSVDVGETPPAPVEQPRDDLAFTPEAERHVKSPGWWEELQVQRAQLLLQRAHAHVFLGGDVRDEIRGELVLVRIDAKPVSNVREQILVHVQEGGGGDLVRGCHAGGRKAHFDPLCCRKAILQRRLLLLSNGRPESALRGDAEV